jgi:hypothetical protein
MTEPLKLWLGSHNTPVETRLPAMPTDDEPSLAVQGIQSAPTHEDHRHEA